METEDNNVTEEKEEKEEKEGKEGKDNAVGNLLTVAAVIVFIIGFILGLMSEPVFLIWAVAFLIGIIFLALAEIVNLLQDIYDKIGK